MISLLKKVTILFIIIIALFFTVEDLFSIDKGETNLLTSLFHIKETGKQSLKEQPIKEQSVKKQSIKEVPLKKQVVKKQVVVKKPQQQKQLKKQSKKPVLENRKILNVPLINQLDAPRLYNGCEVTSLAMILNYNGYHVTKNELADHIVTVRLTYKNELRGNPNEGFVGDMDDGPGYAVYNRPIYNLAKKYAGNKVVNLTNRSFNDLLVRVRLGEPVWIITTATFAPVSDFKTWHTPQGTIKITFSEHSVVITGYDNNYIYINNPYGQKNERLNRNTFEKAWEQMGKQAISIEK